MFWPYVAPLFVITALSLFGSARMIRTALAIFLNWCANTAFVYATGIYDPWLWFVATDAAAAFVVLYHPAGKLQAAIGWTFMAQILLHGVYALSNQNIAAYPYWQALTALAFVQLLLLGGWIVDYLLGRDGSNLGSTDQAGQNGREGMA